MPRPPIASGTMLTPVTAAGILLGFPPTRRPLTRTVVQGQCSVGNLQWDACQGSVPFIVMNEARRAVTLKQNRVISLLQIILTKDHIRAREARWRGSPEHLILIL
ncbi:unnamed protein product [Calypogeia fissa]